MARRDEKPVDREQPPLELRDRSIAFRPAFVWVETVVDGPNGEPGTGTRLDRQTPPAAVARAEAIETELKQRLDELEVAAPAAGEVRDRVLAVMALIPPGHHQEVVTVLKERPPFWGVTTRRISHRA